MTASDARYARRVLKDSFYNRAGKRFFDLTAATGGVLLLSPLLLLLAVLVKCSSRGPVLFRQTRVGKFGLHFQILKLRSMRVGSELGSPLTASGDPRVTPVGAWLRRTKLDELPQLFNVLRGEMSLVGPRPEVPEFAAQYSAAQREVLSFCPGMTGASANIYEEDLLAGCENKEVFYLNTILPAKIQIDLDYCRQLSFATDLRILYRTFAKLLIKLYGPDKRVSHSLLTSFGVPTTKK